MLFKGLGTALVTPFEEDGSVDFASLEKLVDNQLKGGVDALIVCGTTGEPPTLTDSEKSQVVRFVAKQVNGRIPVIAGTGSNCTATAAENSRRAEDMGADGVLVVTPYYNKCTQKGIVEYYSAICEATTLPVIAYNVPPRTGVNILPATAEELSYIPNMAGIKEACGNMEQICETMRRIRPRMDLYSGDDNLNIPIMAIGGAGLISVASNIVPAQIKEVATAMQKCKLAKANKIHEKILPLIDACFVEVNPIPVKAGCNMIGLEAGVPRAPLTELEEEHKKLMKKCIKSAGLKVC